MTQPASLVRRGATVEIRIRHPPVNALSWTVRQGLAEALAKIDSCGAEAAILCGGDGRFIAGADITELDQPIAAPDLLAIEAEIAALKTPVVAAIEGRALGGGLLLALMCDARIALRNARFGFPEVHLGLLATFGGTQILPRLCGPQQAAAMLADGREISAAEAHKAGLIDEICSDGDVVEAAVQRARSYRKRRVLAAPAPPASARAEIEALLRQSEVESPGFLAPKAALKAILLGLEAPLATALSFEGEMFETLRKSAQSRVLRTLFFAERAALRAPADDMKGMLCAPGLMEHHELMAFAPSPSGGLSRSEALAIAAARGARLVHIASPLIGDEMADAMSRGVADLGLPQQDVWAALRAIGFSGRAARHWSLAAKVQGAPRPHGQSVEASLRDALVAAIAGRDGPQFLNLLAVWVLGWPRWRADLFSD